MSRPFAPRHALVTGAAGAIGAALCRRLSASCPGLHLSLVDRDAAGLAALRGQLPEEAAGRAAALTADLSLPALLPALWAEAVAGGGPVDLLVNCAGFMEMRSLGATPWELGERLLLVDLISPLRLMSLAVAGMGGQGGWIVNVSSMAGRVPLRGCSYYGAAKAGLAMASDVAQLELAPQGIHVVTVLPGPVRSALEARARGQVRQGLLTRHLPTGEAEELARRIERALRRGQRRVAYPGIYRVADALPGLAGRFTAAFSPPPTDEPD